MKLGNRIFPNHFIQGPLAGVSLVPFRRLVTRFSRPAFTCTEMISSKTLIQRSPALMQRFTTIADDEGPVCFQLSANDAQELGQAVRIATDCGADLIDLNCGCPVKKIRSKGAGSKLLSELDKLKAMLYALRQNTHLPVSIKIRVEGDSDDQFHETLCEIIGESELDFVTVHGRHWTERYDTPCRYDDIAYFAKQLSIPVLGNGDIEDNATYAKMIETGVAGVMIGRASVGQPWLIGALQSELNGETFQLPTLVEMGEVFIEHVEGICALFSKEKFALLHARKLAKCYARALPQKVKFCEEIQGCSTLAEMKMVVNKYFL